jgi:rubrerythrin
VGVWGHIRDALSAVWTGLQGPRVDERTQLLAWLTEAWSAERRLAAELRQLAPAVPYEQFRASLEAMARDDERHAELLARHLGDRQGFSNPSSQVQAPMVKSALGNVWRRLLGILREKRDLYERYRQEAVFLDDADVQSLLTRLRAEEERHQEQLLDMLTRLDAHVQETIT